MRRAVTIRCRDGFWTVVTIRRRSLRRPVTIWGRDRVCLRRSIAVNVLSLCWLEASILDICKDVVIIKSGYLSVIYQDECCDVVVVLRDVDNDDLEEDDEVAEASPGSGCQQRVYPELCPPSQSLTT